MSARRPIFQDGERLTAQRLNDAFGFVDDRARRAQLGTLGSGVATGFQLSTDASLPTATLRIEPGLAVDGAGRVLVNDAAQVFTLDEIMAQTGPLASSARVLVHVKGSTPVVSSFDPCATREVTADRPIVGFSTSAATSSLSTSSFSNSASLPAWSELSGRTADDVAVVLGSFVAPPLGTSGALAVSMAERQGLGPRADVLRNSFGHRVAVLRDDTGNAQLELTAPTFGSDITATRIGGGIAAPAPSDPRVLLASGGVGPVSAGRAGVIAVPMQLDPINGPVDAAGIPLEIAEPDSAGTARVRRAGASPNLLALGVSAAPAYDAGGVTVVPVATAGVVEVRVRSAGGAGIQLGALLQLFDGSVLRPITTTPAVIVARAAQRSSVSVGDVTMLAWVCPPQLITALPPIIA